jgi:methionyl-tRNA formyltransferase
MGVTCHYMVGKVDPGPIVSQSLLKYRAGDTYEIIRTKTIYLMAKMMCDSTLKILSGQVTRDRARSDSGGPWFSPMRNPDTIQAVKDNLLQRTYQPVPFPNQDTLDVTDIDISALSWAG